MINKFKTLFLVIMIVIVSSIFGGVSSIVFLNNYCNKGLLSKYVFQNTNFCINKGKENKKETVVKVREESSTIDVVEKVSPAVVSIIVSKDLPIIEKYYNSPSNGSTGFFERFFGFNNFATPQYRQKGTEKKEIGGGSGFIVSHDGYIVTNKHVVFDKSASYTAVMNNGKKYDAKVLALDPLTDLAILKIDGDDFDSVDLGDSDELKVGQSVIAIGNSLGEFRNTVSTGVVSGLSRSIVAGGIGSQSEQLMGLIQTDASINPGNSGGPLLDLSGKVIAVNTAMASGAENIGFAIPINELKNTINSVKENGRIIRPWLGLRYMMINKEIAKNNNLSVNYGALIIGGESLNNPAIISQSPADKAGLKEGDIILEIDGKKVEEKNSLSKIITSYKPGDKITIKLWRNDKEIIKNINLEEMP